MNKLSDMFDSLGMHRFSNSHREWNSFFKFTRTLSSIFCLIPYFLFCFLFLQIKEFFNQEFGNKSEDAEDGNKEGKTIEEFLKSPNEEGPAPSTADVKTVNVEDIFDKMGKM